MSGRREDPAMHTTPRQKRHRFAELHAGSDSFLLPNPWDAGSARLMVHAGAVALATTSAGLAWSHGRDDYGITRDILVAHVQELTAATEVPLNVDSERCFAEDPDGVAETVRMLHEAGAAGCSIEDWNRATGETDPIDFAVERVAAAAAAAHADPDDRLLVTARCESFLHGSRDLDAVIARLVAYRDAGADCVYAPGLTTLEQVRTLVDALEVPVNVLGVLLPCTVAEIGAAGARRISTGGAVAAAAYGAAMRAMRELLGDGTTTFLEGRLANDDKAAFAP